MNFCWTTLRVSNMEESLKFYHEILGLPIASKHGGGDLQIVMLGAEDKAKIELLHDKNSNVSPQVKGLSIGFEVESLEEALDFMKEQGIPMYKEPFSPNPHVRYFFIKDPDGIEVQIVENR